MQIEKNPPKNSVRSVVYQEWINELIMDSKTQTPPFPERRIISVYVDRLLDQMVDIEMDIDIDKQEFADILNRQIYPAMLSDTGSAIDAMISRFDGKAIGYLMGLPSFHPFLLGFMGVLALNSTGNTEVSHFFQVQKSEQLHQMVRSDEIRKKLALASEIIRYIQLNTYEPDAVLQMVRDSAAGTGCLMGILAGYCHLFENYGA